MKEKERYQCSRCNVWKYAQHFSGGRARCKPCERERKRELAEQRVHVEPPIAKVCTGCSELRPREHFRRCKANRDGLQRWCKTCANASTRASRQ